MQFRNLHPPRISFRKNQSKSLSRTRGCFPKLILHNTKECVWCLVLLYGNEAGLTIPAIASDQTAIREMKIFFTSHAHFQNFNRFEKFPSQYETFHFHPVLLLAVGINFIR